MGVRPWAAVEVWSQPAVEVRCLDRNKNVVPTLNGTVVPNSIGTVARPQVKCGHGPLHNSVFTDNRGGMVPSSSGESASIDRSGSVATDRSISFVATSSGSFVPSSSASAAVDRMEMWSRAE